MPIPFTCPHCGARSTVDDQFAGQTGPCASCGQTITIPALAGYSGGTPPPRRKSSAAPALLIGALVVLGAMCVIGPILVALLLPAIQSTRGRACSNNMKVIGIALHNYIDVYQTFPPAVTYDANGRPMHSWRVLILPFADNDALYQEYDMNQPWDGPNNSRLLSRMPAFYACPSHSSTGTGLFVTAYMAVVGEGTAFPPGGAATRPSDIVDGQSKTICVVESQTPVKWMEPVDLDFDSLVLAINAPGGGLAGNHAAGMYVLLCDGSVKFIRDDLSPEMLRLLLLRDDGEVILSPDW